MDFNLKIKQPWLQVQQPELALQLQSCWPVKAPRFI